MHRKQRGFLIALCLCMLSLSGIFGIYQYRRGQAQDVPEQTADRRAEDGALEEDAEREAANSTGTVARADTQDEKTKEAKIETEEDLQEIGEAEFAQAEPEELAESQPEEDAEPEQNQAQENSAPALLTFAENSRLMWPVNGDVILNYSMDKSIYFATLNQYKYHPAIVISAEPGTEVWCAAQGKVTQIKVDEETGTTVSMDLGSGYEAVYGQMKELAVKEGDMVSAGALLGYVSEPTKYYTVEGSNLYFQLLRDGEPVNPMDYLE